MATLHCKACDKPLYGKQMEEEYCSGCLNVVQYCELTPNLEEDIDTLAFVYNLISTE